MSTATLPPPSPAAPGPRSTPPPRSSPPAPSPSAASVTPRSSNPGFGENAVAGPSRPPTGPIPNFPPGTLAALNGGDLSHQRLGQNAAPTSNGHASLEQAALQSRLMLAQRAMKATMMQTAKPPTLGQGDNPLQGAGAMRDGNQGGKGSQDTSKMADAIGMLQNMNGSNKEAMMKQLQALRNSGMQPGKPLANPHANQPSSLPMPSAAPTAQISTPLSTSEPLSTPSYPPSQPTVSLNGLSQPSQFAPPRNPSLSSATAPSPSAPSPNVRPPQAQTRPTVRPTLNLAGLTQGNGMMDEAAIRAAALNMTPEQRDAFVGHQKAMMAAQRASVAAQQGGSTQETPNQPGSNHPPLRMNHVITNSLPRPSDSNGNGPYNPSTTPSVAAPTSLPSGPVRPPGPGPNPNQPPNAATSNQRKQFVQTLFSYHKSLGQNPPPEILSGPVPGAIQMGDYTVELVDLFMTIMRQANGQAGMMGKNGEPHPVFANYVASHNFPSTLPAPVKCPKPDGSTLPIPDETTDSVRFLFMVYVTYLQGFEHHMHRQRSAMMSQRQAVQQGQQGQDGGQAQGQQQQQQQGGQQGPHGPGPGPQPMVQQGPQQPQIQQYQQQQQPPQQQSQPQQPQQQQQYQIQPQPYPQQAQTPTSYQPPTPTSYQPPTPTTTAFTPSQLPSASPISSTSQFPNTGPAYPPVPSYMTPSAMPVAPSPPASGTPKPRGPKPRKDGKAGPPPIKSEGLTNVGNGPSSGNSVTTTATTPTTATGRKRKKTKKELAAEKLASETGSIAPTPTSTTGPVTTTQQPPARPSTPKRARYKVEYRPLHHPVNHMCGWDERAVSSTFPKYNLAQPSRPIHELGLVDMEAILMGLRSRMRRETGYGLTVLSMLSMPHPEDGMMGLPIQRLQEIFQELLDILEELALGDEGLEGWKGRNEKRQKGDEEGLGEDQSKMDFLELEQLGRDIDWSVPDTPDPPTRRTDHTGGNTDTILSILNLLRNFSLLEQNQPLMASHPGLFHILAAITDISLARMPNIPSTSNSPYSVLELARVRRDTVSILSNLGPYIDLKKVEPWSVLAIYRLLASFLNSAWTTLGTKESWYSPHLSGVTHPLPIIHSIDRALQAWCTLSHDDSNREILSHIPSEELVGLYENLIKLLPITRRQLEALHANESYLGMTECLALSLHSLAFLAPLNVRSQMRHIPGGTDIILRLIQTTASITPPPSRSMGGPTPPIDPLQNALSVLCRRLAETLGVLNGTVSCSTERQERISFSAASSSHAGWSFSNRAIEKGWLAGREEMVCGITGRNGVDGIVRQELDGMWWAANAEV